MFATARTDDANFVPIGTQGCDHFLDMNGLPVFRSCAVMIKNLHSSIDFRLLQSHL